MSDPIDRKAKEALAVLYMSYAPEVLKALTQKLVVLFPEEAREALADAGLSLLLNDLLRPYNSQAVDLKRREAKCNYQGPWNETGPWDNDATFRWRTVVWDGLPSIECWHNGVQSFVTLNPSPAGGSPDVFVYLGAHGDPAYDDPQVYVTPTSDED
jgi:hypothetical protein